MRKFSQKYTIIQLFEEVPESAFFSSNDWPLHSTIIDTFAIDWTVDVMAEALSTLLSDYTAIKTVATKDEFFGLEKQTHVILIDMSDSLIKLHYDVVELLENGGLRLNDPQFAKKGFLSHATVQKHARLSKGETVTFNALSIVDMFPDEDPHKRRILKTIKFSDKNTLISVIIKK